MEEVFVYKCPNCGGKVDYDNNRHLWICAYCNNSYEALFHQVEKVLPSVEEAEVTAYGYICSKCGKKYVSLEKENAKCVHCNEINGQGKEFLITNMIINDKPESLAKREFINSLEPFGKFLPQEFLKENLKCEYVNCDLYNGCVKVSSNTKSVKYIFVNLLIPNIEYDDYRFMYEVGNMGLKNTRAFHNEKDTILKKVIGNGDSFYSFEDMKFEDDIVNQCVESFMYKYKITNRNELKVETSLRIKDGTYITIYIDEVTYNNKKYRHYDIGTTYAEDKNAGFFKPNKGTIIFSFPEEPDSRRKTKTSQKLSSLFMTLAILSFLSPLFSYLFKVGGGDIIVIISISLGILFSILFLSYNKKYNYYLRTIKLTKEEYFNQIINNSNYVKIIEVKK